MAFNVRIFGHAGLTAMKVVDDSGQARTDSVYHLQQPYLWQQLLSVTAAPISSAAIVPPVSGHTADPTSILHIEVPDGQTVRYEINGPNRNAVAGINSPSLSGKNQFQFGAGYVISLIDASGLA